MISINKILKDSLYRRIVSSKISKGCWSVFRAVLMIGLGFVIIYPLLIKFSASFKSLSDINDPTTFLIPSQMTLSNYVKVIDFIHYIPTLLNTAGFTVLCSLLQTAACTLVAYGLARFKFWGKNIIFALVILTLIIPSQTILVPLYLQFKSFNLISLFTLLPNGNGIPMLNTYWPFVFMSASALGIKNGLFIYLLRQYFINMPKVLEEAAYLDGCGTFKTFTKIMLPGAVPMIMTVFLFSFVWLWNDYYYTAFLAPSMDILATQIGDVGRRINTVAGDFFNGTTGAIYNNTAMMLHMIPLIILYTFTQRYFVESVEKSGIVG